VDGGSVAAARLLLDSGAGVGTSGGRLLTSAASQGSAELVRLLLDHGAEAARAESLGPLHADRTIARLLVARGFELNAPIRDQEPPLTRACRADKGEQPAAVAALLELGADPNAKNAKGRTPLAVATSAHFDRTVALLRAAGAG
jgi:ankyrin repeat protein